MPCYFFFFFKQKTAYELRISDWSSDVCSSDLLPEGELTQDQANALASQFKTHIAAPGAQLALIPRLVNFDQMPQSFQETRNWTQRLALQALGLSNEACPLGPPSDPDGMLADARFLVGAIAVPKGQPVFRWQVAHEDHRFPSREQCHKDWRSE